MFVQGLIIDVIWEILWLLTVFSCVRKHGILCAEDFGKPITDPCCENVRVHYKQRTVYEILNLQLDDLQKGINCFQRVCPSQFPAFYRVMYAGNFPGTSVSFAVCSDGEHVELDGREGQGSATGGRPRNRGMNIRSVHNSTRRGGREGNHSKELKKRHLTFRTHEESNNNPKLLFRNDWILNDLKRNASRDYLKMKHVTSGQTSNNISSSRRKRDADTTRNIFEIPEPRPSIVYTLTGVCFCLKVQSNIQATEHDQPSDVKSDRIYRFLEKKRDDPDSGHHLDSSDAESFVKSKSNVFSKKSYSHQKGSKLKRQSNKNTGDKCSNGDCTLPDKTTKRRRRSTFLDSFMKAILEVQHTRGNQSMTELSPTDPSTTSTSNSNDIHRAWTDPRQTVAWLPTVENKPTYTTLRDSAEDYQTASSESRGRRMEDDPSEGGSNDDPIDTDEFKDKLVVFASFSHDVHFIGSITMTVSVASSCRSNVPLSPETNNTSNVTRPTNANPGDIVTVTPTPVRRTTSAAKNIVVPVETMPTQEGTSTSPPTTTLPEDTIPSSLVNEVTENRHSNDRQDDAHEEEDGGVDVLLVWQISAGATFAVLLLLLLVLATSFYRRRTRRRKKRYSSVTPDSTLQRFQPPVPPVPPNGPLPQRRANQSIHELNREPGQLTTAVNIAVPDTITIPRTIQAVSRNDPPQIFNVGTVQPMHIRLRSLSAAAEAARLRGQEALRMLNNEKENSGEEAENTNNSLVAMRPVPPLRAGITNSIVPDNTGQTETSHSSINRLSVASDSNSTKQLLSPTIVVSQGSNTREFDLGQFAVYRNDIMLKLRRCGLRTGRRKRKSKPGTTSRDYDNDDNYGTGSIYSCYAGGETDI